MSIEDSIRRQLAILARRPRARVTEFDPTRPTDWRPASVRNPFAMLDTHFSDAAAWELIASKLEDGHDVETVELQNPPGVTGYVMKIVLEPDAPILYVKLELGSGRIWGRSFHYSKPE